MSNLELIKELELLDNDKYISVAETEKQKKQSKKEIIESEKEEKRKLLFEIQQEKLKNIKEKKNEIKNTDDEYTELHGRSKLENQNLIKQYILLFPQQLQDFKYKKTGTNEQLIEVINEIRAIVEIGTVDSFVPVFLYLKSCNCSGNKRMYS